MKVIALSCKKNLCALFPKIRAVAKVTLKHLFLVFWMKFLLTESRLNVLTTATALVVYLLCFNYPSKTAAMQSVLNTEMVISHALSVIISMIIVFFLFVYVEIDGFFIKHLSMDSWQKSMYNFCVY